MKAITPLEANEYRDPMKKRFIVKLQLFPTHQQQPSVERLMAALDHSSTWLLGRFQMARQRLLDPLRYRLGLAMRSVVVVGANKGDILV